VARGLADGAFYNAGQSCCSVERVYVHESIYEPFVAAFLDEVASFVAGSEWDPATYLGPLCLPSQPAFLRAQVADALAKGATQLTPRLDFKAPPTPRHFPPTVLSGVTPDMDVHRVESFGPLVTLTKVPDVQTAIDLTNDSSYGLTAAVYSPGRQRAESILRCLKTGTAYWNCCDRTSPALPWQGRRDSGIGLTMSSLGIQAMAVPRAYHLNFAALQE